MDMKQLRLCKGGGVCVLLLSLWNSWAVGDAISGDPYVPWVDGLIVQVDGAMLDAGEPMYPVAGSGGAGSWEYVGGLDPAAGWYPALLWEAELLTGVSDYGYKAMSYAKPLRIGVSGELGDLEWSGYGEALHRWRAVAWQSIPEENLSDYLASFEARWMPEVGAFWYTSEGKVLDSMGLSGGWQGRDTTSAASVMEMAEVLRVATVLGRDEWRARALSHIEVVLREHLRPDGSTAEIVAFGEDGATACADRGYGPETSFAQSHALMLLGLGRVMHVTGNRQYIAEFNRMADYLLSHLGDDGLPLWDAVGAQIDVSDLSARYAVLPGELSPLATDSKAGALLALALLESVPVQSGERGWQAFTEAQRLVEALHAKKQLLGTSPLLADVHGLFPGDLAGSLVADYCYIRSMRLLADLTSPTRPMERIAAGDSVESLRVTSPKEWAVGSFAGQPALQCRPVDVGDGAPMAIALVDGVVYESFDLSVLAWPRESDSSGEAEPVVVFGYVSPEDYLILSIGRTSGTTRLIKVEGEERILLAQVDGGLPSSVTFHELLVVVRDGVLSVDLGGFEIMSVNLGSALRSGLVGFGATGPFWFDAFEVIGESAPTAARGVDVWRRSSFGTSFSVESWDESDPDADGVNNLIEYLYGSDPTSNQERNGYRVIGMDTGGLQMTWPTASRLLDTKVQLERSTDGITWTEVQEEALAVGGQPGEATARVALSGPRTELFRMVANTAAVE